MIQVGTRVLLKQGPCDCCFSSLLGSLVSPRPRCRYPYFGLPSLLATCVRSLTQLHLLTIYFCSEGLCVFTATISAREIASCTDNSSFFGVYIQVLLDGSLLVLLEPIVYVVPFWIRFVQCAYMIVTTRKHGTSLLFLSLLITGCSWAKHLHHYVNLVKYSSGILVIGTSLLKDRTAPFANCLSYLRHQRRGPISNLPVLLACSRNIQNCNQLFVGHLYGLESWYRSIDFFSTKFRSLSY